MAIAPIGVEPGADSICAWSIAGLSGACSAGICTGFEGAFPSVLFEDRGGAFLAGFGAGLAVFFFAGAGIVMPGIDMPGMFICWARAGAETNGVTTAALAVIKSPNFTKLLRKLAVSGSQPQHR